MTQRDELLDDPEEAQLQALEGLQAKMWTALPGVVVNVNLAAQTCSVQPTIQGVVLDAQNNEQNVNLPVLPDVPILFPRTAGFALTLPVGVGDEVLVVFSSRAIDSWWQSGGIGAPIEARMHSLSDGFAILAPTSQPKKLANVQADGIELRNADRSVFIKVSAAGISSKGPWVHEGPFSADGISLPDHIHSNSGGIGNGGPPVP